MSSAAASGDVPPVPSVSSERATPAVSTAAWRWIVVLCAAVYLLLVRRFDFVCDDAYITFRYAKNLAEGHGARFNLGDGPPVEGYSNFLWMLIAALVEVLGGAPQNWMRVLSVASGLVLLVAVMRFARERFAHGVGGTVATGLFLGTLPVFTMWSTGGLATVPAALFLFLGFALLFGAEPRGAAAGACLLVSGLLRADGAAWAGLVLVCALGTWWRRRDPRLWRAGWVAAAILVVGVGAHVAWRYGYYGDFLPNTARIKTGLTAARLDRGVGYVVSCFLTMPAMAAGLVVGVVMAVRRRDAVLWTALAVVVATLSYALYTGGDFMAMGRFTMPMVPFLALLVAGLWAGGSGGPGGPRDEERRRAVPSAIVAACVATSLLATFDVPFASEPVRERFHFRLSADHYWSEVRMWERMRDNCDSWTRMGKAMAKMSEPGESMVLGPIGAMGYYSGMYLYDELGLVSREVTEAEREPILGSPGHDRKVSYSFFLPWKPDYIGPPMIAQAEDKFEPKRLPVLKRRDYSRVKVEVYVPPDELGIPDGFVVWMFRLLYDGEETGSESEEE